MIKKFFNVLLIFILGVLITSNVFAYSDDLFKFDLPDTYGNMSYNNMYIFTDAEDTNRGMIIYAKESVGLKKSVWNIDDSDLNELIRNLGTTNKVIETDKKAKLGKEKAIKIIAQSDDDYIEAYILASNKYMYMVTFIGDTQADLNNSDYQMIKDSFKLKDRTTNPVGIIILITIIIVLIKGFFTYRKNKKMNATANTPVNTPENIPENIPVNTPENIQGNTPVNTPENIPENAPEKNDEADNNNMTDEDLKE